MRKIISLYQRNYDGDRLVRDEVVPGAEWVGAGEGIATRKYDGTCCMVKDNILYKRFDAKHGKPAPYGFVPAQDPDPVTGHWPGWVEVGNGAEDKWFRDAVKDINKVGMADGTFELIGPKVNGNHEGMKEHMLVRHGYEKLEDAPRTYEAIKAYLADGKLEGIVWHHPDDRMVKIKGKDFGIKRTEPKPIFP